MMDWIKILSQVYFFFTFVPAWEPAGSPHPQQPANGQINRLWWCCTAQQYPLHSPSAGQSWVCLSRVGPWRARVTDLWLMEPGCGDLRAAEWRLPLPRWEQRGDLPEHLPSWLQLSQGLLPGSQSGSPGLRLLVLAVWSRQAASSRALPTGAVAAGRPAWWTSQSRGMPGHHSSHLLHRQEETPDWCPAYRWSQEFHPKSPSAVSLKPEERFTTPKQPSIHTASPNSPDWTNRKPGHISVVQCWGCRGCRFLWKWASRWCRCKRRRY